MRSNTLNLQAVRLEHLLHAKGKYSHVHVRPRAGHLIIEVEDADGNRSVVARATCVGAGQYGLSFRNGAGRWETLPLSGTMEQVVAELVESLGPYLDSANL